MLTSFLDAIDCIFRREENYARLGMKHFSIFRIRKNNVVLSENCGGNLGKPGVITG